MIEALLGPVVILFGVGAALMWYGSRSVPAKVRRGRWVKYATYAVLVWGVIGLAWLHDRRPLIGAALLMVCGGTYELGRALLRATPRVRWIAWSVHILLSACLLRLTTIGPQDRPGIGFFLIFVVTCTFDAFSQVTGQIWGRRKLAPRLSPGKTVVGALGGLVCAVGIMFCFGVVHARWVESGLPVSHSIGAALQFAVPISLAAFAGDLFYSWIKRRCRIKDFGTLLPGHGGVLDRFDSLLGSAALVVVATALGYF